MNRIILAVKFGINLLNLNAFNNIVNNSDKYKKIANPVNNDNDIIIKIYLYFNEIWLI